MTLLWACILWVFCSATVATLPMRLQYIPGVILLIAAPVLIILIGLQVGWLYSLLALAAFVSMFRNPLRFLLAKLRGQNPEVPTTHSQCPKIPHALRQPPQDKTHSSGAHNFNRKLPS